MHKKMVGFMIVLLGLGGAAYIYNQNACMLFSRSCFLRSFFCKYFEKETVFVPDQDIDLHNQEKDGDVSPSKTGVTLVFDLHGVLLSVDAKKALSEIGLSQIVKYSYNRNIRFSSIEEELTLKTYEILNLIQPYTSETPVVYDLYGNRMPSLMCQWQQGVKSTRELKLLVEKALDAHPEWFKSDIERQLVRQIMVKMFTPELLITTVKLIPEGLKLVKKYKKQGHTLIAFTNWDPESFELLENQFPELFALFDYRIISGFTHHMKPQKEAFDYLVTRKAKYGETIIVIDDQQENIDEARRLGLEGILCETKTNLFGFNGAPDFGSVEKKVAEIVHKSVHCRS